MLLPTFRLWIFCWSSLINLVINIWSYVKINDCGRKDLTFLGSDYHLLGEPSQPSRWQLALVWKSLHLCNGSFLLFPLICLFLERKGGEKRGRETSMCGCLLCASHWRPCCNPGMCPDWELNQWPFGSQASTQSTGHTSQGLFLLFKTA